MKVQADQDLVLQFFLTFSCFEFALKSSNFLKPPGRNDDPKTGYRAEPDWEAFAKSIAGQFSSGASAELKKACEYFELNPPWRELVANNSLMWDARAESATLSEAERILRYVRRVRNNLFHGGKFSSAPVKDVGRNASLIAHSLTILKHCLQLSPAVHTAYEDGTL